MTIKDEAEQLVNDFRILLINEDTECGNEILCTDIAKKCALISINNTYFGIYNYLKDTNELQNADREFAHWELLKKEVKKL